VFFPRRSACLRATSLLAGLTLGLAVGPAAAQNLFDFLFGGLRRPAPPPSASSYADPNAHPFGARPVEPNLETGPAVAFCVRLCDGRYFPIQRASGLNPAQACGSFCPAARTKVFSGSAIATAAAGDGARYKDLPTAFAYRERTVADCTCNGRDAYGLVTPAANADPTLRPGDIVATERGFLAYNGAGGRAEFTPIKSYSGLPAELRQKLAGAKIEPRASDLAQERGVAAPATDKRVQLAR